MSVNKVTAVDLPAQTGLGLFEENLVLDFDYYHYEIECIDVSGGCLFVGANDSWVLKYENESKAPGKLRFSSKKRIAKTMGLKKSVDHIVVSSALERCLVLCDSNLLVLDSMSLDPVSSSQSRIKGVNLFCLNENPRDCDPFELQVCAVRKKKFCLYILKEDQFHLRKEISTNAIPTAIAMDGSFICAGMPTHYAIYDCLTSASQVLFGKESEKEPSIVRRIGNEEFLVLGPGRLGVFVKSDGGSNRPPLTWNAGVIAASYSHPFILALTPDSILVFSLTDYQLKESLPFFSGKSIGNFDGFTLVYSKRAVSQMCSISWDMQVKALMDSGRLEEALDFAIHSHHTGLTKEQFQVEFQKLQQKVAIKCFSSGNFFRAAELFTESRADVRDVIGIFPDLQTDLTYPLLFDTDDLRAARYALTDPDFSKNAANFLESFLLNVRHQCIDADAKRSLDTALVLLLTQLDNLTKLIEIAYGTKLVVVLPKCIHALESKSKFAQSIIFWNTGNENEAFQIWVKLALSEYTDILWPGIDFLVKKLSNQKDLTLFWRYIGMILKSFPDIGLQILKNRCEITAEFDIPKLSVETVGDFLQQYPFVLQDFLEYLVFERGDQTEKFHTQLALLLADSTLQSVEKGFEDDPSRIKLQKLLQDSKVVKHQIILGRVEQTKLRSETAIIYGKLGEYRKAFHILVVEQSQHEKAISLCLSSSQKRMRERALYELLSTYLDSEIDTYRKDEFQKLAKELLTLHGHEFSVLEVLKILPANWNLKDMETLCIAGARSALSSNRMRKVERMLLSYELLEVNEELSRLQSEKTVIKQIYCKVCQRQIFSSGFARYPNGTICHVSCVLHKNICPVTGELFSFSK